jgi:hypothetical protein
MGEYNGTGTGIVTNSPTLRTLTVLPLIVAVTVSVRSSIAMLVVALAELPAVNVSAALAGPEAPSTSPSPAARMNHLQK